MLDLSPKQKQAFKESDARLNFWVGSVRSGKTYSSLIRWLEFIQYAPTGNLAIIGRTASTIKRNLVDEICNLIGSDAKYYIGRNEMTLWNKRIYLIAGNDERAEGKLRGICLSGAYCDETTLLPEGFFVMLLSRLSTPGAKLFATTNPDSPFHWLKKNYLDRSNELDLKIFNFYLDDNPSLTDIFKENLKKEYQGLWYKRFILGQWCVSEGAIFDFFDESIHVIKFAPTSARYYICGVDYGTANPTAFTLLGYDPNNFPNAWIEEEYYYDSKEHNRQKTDSEYSDDLQDFIKGRNIKEIVIDPSAASFKAELIKCGVQNIVDANNDVLDGIRFMSKLLSNGTLKICANCVNLIRECQTYCWDDKSTKLGIDKPLKKNDHILDATRYALMTCLKPIYDGTAEIDIDQYRRWKNDQGWR